MELIATGTETIDLFKYMYPDIKYQIPSRRNKTRKIDFLYVNEQIVTLCRGHTISDFVNDITYDHNMHFMQVEKQLFQKTLNIT